MTEQMRHDELNTAIDVIVSRAEFATTGDAELDGLARLATGLRGLAAPGFRARLRAELVAGHEPRGLTAWMRGRLPIGSSFTRERGLAAAGGGCGLVAGGCCVGGTIVNLLGLASAASVAAFIE